MNFFPAGSERWLAGCGLTALAALTLLSLGCGGGDPDIMAPPATFSVSTTGPGPDGVRLDGIGLHNGIALVQVVVGGPTSSNDLYSFAFDLVLSDPEVARYVPGSARFGNALEIGPTQGMSVLVLQNRDRVVIGASKTGGGPGNGIAGSKESVILSLEFELLAGGSTTLRFAGSPSNPVNPTGDPVALDSQGGLVPSITFDGEPAFISR